MGVDNQDTLLWHSELMNFPAIITPVGWVTEATATSRVQPQCSSLHLKPSWLQGPPHFILTDQPCSGLDGSSTEILNVSKIRTEKKSLLSTTFCVSGCKTVTAQSCGWSPVI